MNKIGIDVSSYQGVIDWNKVSGAGVEFSILKIIRKDLQPDKQFENNYSGCIASGISVHGVYNYSYANTVEKARKDAARVIEVLNGRKAVVYMDVEDNCLVGLGENLIKIIDSYAEVITKAGLDFGVYTGYSFYNSYIKPYGELKYPLWIARYGLNNGSIQEKYEPQISGMIGWQYTSKGSIAGISGNVDLNVWYGDIKTFESNETANHVKTAEELAQEVLNGIWGNGVDRKQNLIAAGYDYDAVQKKVNELLNVEKKTYYKVKTGDTLSGIAKQFDTTVNALLEMNKIANKNKIYVNQMIRVK